MEIFSEICFLPRERCAEDVIDEQKVREQIGIYCKTIELTREELKGKKITEIGSGNGIFVSVPRRYLGLKIYEIELSGPGFDICMFLHKELL